MDVFYKIIALLGGLAMFLYGMRVMGDGLKNCSGGAMRAALAKVTNRPIMGFLLGLLVTCMIQSSTATIVLTVGLVGAGFLTFRQSIGIVLGANVGTAITAQVIRLMDLDAGSSSLLYFFKADNLAPLALIIGIVLIMFLRKNTAKNIGSIAAGFGILFMGLIFMSDAVDDMSAQLSGFLTTFEDHYFLGFLAGVAVTGVIQSSSAVIGILQSFASTMGLSFCSVFAVIIGVNIGDCLTTFLVCRLGAKPDQIRTTLVHVIYNIFAAMLIVVCILIGRATNLITDDLWNMPLHSGGIANLHGLFRLGPALLLMPLCNIFARIAEKLVPDAPTDEEDADIERNLRELDNHLVENPALALDQAAHLIGHMGDVACHNFDAAVTQIYTYDPSRDARIIQRENMLDRMADASNQYIVAVSPHIMLNKDYRNQNFQIRALVCFERIGDLAININENVAKLRESGNTFSSMAMEELQIVISAVSDILTLSVEAYKSNSTEMALRIEPLEEVVDELIEQLKERHIFRMTHQQCNMCNGIFYQNILQNLERVADQCSDLGVYLLSRTNESITGQEHQYIHNLHHSGDPEYMAMFHANHQRYFDRLNAVEALDGEASL